MKMLNMRYVFPLVFVALDYIAVVLAEKMAFAVRCWFDPLNYGTYSMPNLYSYIFIPLIFIMFLGSSKAYIAIQPILKTVKDVFYSILGAFITCILFLYFTQEIIFASRLYVVSFGVFALFAIYAFRYFTKKIMKQCSFFMEPVILIGAGKTAESILHFFEGDLGYRYDILGLVDDHPKSVELPQKYLLLGNLAEVESIVKNAGVQTVIIAAPGLPKDSLQLLIARLQPLVRNISFVPDLIGTPMASVELDNLFSEKLIMLKIKNNLARRRNRILKRFFDLFLTICGGLAISPILLLVTILVAIENKGDIIFAHKRVGKHGKLFPCYKFQSMVPDAQKKLLDYLATHPDAKQEWEESFKLTNDPRVTKLGAFLRKTSLDELPQLWNVIRGDMSLVGPRPIVTKEIGKYGDFIKEYYMVLPGITGMWQASGRSDTTYEERVEMDTWYVRNWSVWIDLMYLFKTVKAVLCGKGAY